MITFFGRAVLSFAVTLVLCSCALTGGQPRESHKETITKWDLLADYSTQRSILKLNAIAISGAVKAVPNSEQGTSYEITGLGLARSVNETEIDFIHPNILRAVSCKMNGELCLHFNQLTEEDSTSVLTSMFRDKEAELFYLYSNIFLVEEQIRKLHSIAPKLLKSYLIYLAKQEQRFDTIEEFVKHLYQTFTQEQLTQFSKNKGQFIDNADEDPYLYSELPEESRYWSTEAVAGASWNAENTEVNHFIVSDTTEDQRLMSQLKTERKATNSDEYTKVRTFTERKSLPISLNSQVCSYSDNYFGVVSEFLLYDEVIVSTSGVAKTISDGIVRELEPGYLFGEATDIYIKRVRIDKVYPLSDLSVCVIE